MIPMMVIFSQIDILHILNLKNPSLSCAQIYHTETPCSLAHVSSSSPRSCSSLASLSLFSASISNLMRDIMSRSNSNMLSSVSSLDRRSYSTMDNRDYESCCIRFSSSVSVVCLSIDAVTICSWSLGNSTWSPCSSPFSCSTLVFCSCTISYLIYATLWSTISISFLSTSFRDYRVSTKRDAYIDFLLYPLDEALLQSPDLQRPLLLYLLLYQLVFLYHLPNVSQLYTKVICSHSPTLSFRLESFLSTKDSCSERPSSTWETRWRRPETFTLGGSLKSI